MRMRAGARDGRMHTRTRARRINHRGIMRPTTAGCARNDVRERVCRDASVPAAVNRQPSTKFYPGETSGHGRQFVNSLQKSEFSIIPESRAYPHPSTYESISFRSFTRVKYI